MSQLGQLPFYNPLDPARPKIWPGYTLVIPICAVGNIGQLACDLIISTLLSKQECQLIGRLYSPALMAVVGPNAFMEQKINLDGNNKAIKPPPTTSTELYESSKHKLIIMQQRTSYFKSLKHIYINELVNWIKESTFDSVLVLTSSFAQCNPDTSHLGEPCGQVGSICTSNFDASSHQWLTLGLKPIPKKSSIKLVVQDGLTYLPGSGITKPLVNAFERAFIPAAFIVDFCSEGINLHDCYQVVNIVDRLLNLGCNSGGGKWGANQELASTLPSLLASTLYVGDEGAVSVRESGDIAERQIVGWVEPYSWAQAEC